VFPAANILTQNVQVAPGVTSDTKASLSLTYLDFVADVGYNVFYKQGEHVRARNPIPRGTYGIAGANYDGNAEFVSNFIAGSTVDINSAQGTTNTTTAYLSDSDIDRTVAETADQLLHTLYFGFGYAYSTWTTPLMVGVGCSYEYAKQEMDLLNTLLQDNLNDLSGLPVLIIGDDPDFISETLNNFLWATFTRSNPSHDIYGIKSFTEFKHWGCEGPMIIDARLKPHHAPPLELDPSVEKKIDRFFDKGGSLYGVLK